MPIRPENRKLYPKDWKRIAQAVKEAAGWQCQVCGKPHGKMVVCGPGGYWFDAEADRLFAPDGSEIFDDDRFPDSHLTWPTKVILTVHHVNADPTDNRPENLQCLCQYHHLLADRERHARQRRKNRMAKKAVGSLFVEGIAKR